jgi:hypothetical protein
VQRQLSVTGVATPDLGNGASPEDLADDRRVLEQALPLSREGV